VKVAADEAQGGICVADGAEQVPADGAGALQQAPLRSCRGIFPAHASPEDLRPEGRDSAEMLVLILSIHPTDLLGPPGEHGRGPWPATAADCEWAVPSAAWCHSPRRRR
jgi:hypothetical protein